MAKVIIVDSKKENQEAYKVIETTVDFSVIQKEENKLEFDVNTLESQLFPELLSGN